MTTSNRWEERNQVHEESRVSMTFSSHGVQPIVIAAMMTALTSATLPLIQSFARLEQNILWYIVPIFIVSLESVYTTRWLYKPRGRSINRLAYRFSEFAFILVVARISGWWVGDIWPDFGDITYLYRPGIMIADLYFAIGVGVLLFAWGRTMVLARLFFGLSPEGAGYATGDLLPMGQRPYEFSPMQSRGIYWDSYVNSWMWGGVFLILIIAASTLDMPGIPETGLGSMRRLQMPPSLIWFTLVYFGTGFVLMSQGRLSLMHIRWSRRKVDKTAAVESTWVRQGSWLLIIVAGIASVLPLGNSFLLSRLVSTAIFGLLQFVNMLILFVFGLVAWLIPDIETDDTFEFNPADAQPQPEIAPPPDLPFSETVSEPSIVPGALFWVMLFTALGLAFLYMIQYRNIRIDRAQWDKIVFRFREWWASLWGRMATRTSELRDVIVTQFVRDDEADQKQAPWRFIRINSLSPRQKLRYFYLSTIQRAEDRGRGRDDSETPLEFSEDLKEGWPTADEEIEKVTAAFLKARYDTREITEEEAAEVQAHWKRLRGQLRRKKEEGE